MDYIYTQFERDVLSSRTTKMGSAKLNVIIEEMECGYIRCYTWKDTKMQNAL